MDDVFIFLAGTIVTLMVTAAVGLLLWGAAHEPRPGEAPEDREERTVRARGGKVQPDH